MSNESINVTVDSIFTVKLQCQAGSTGYSWALAHMPDSVNLVDVSFETTHSYIAGCTETQVFTFAAIAEDQAYLQFNLIRPWEPENVVDSKTFDLAIEAKNDTANELQKTAGCKLFASFGDACASNGVAAMYMGLAPQQCGSVNALYMGLPVMKYMGPPVMKYMGPPVMKYMGPPVIKYMAPVDTKDQKEDSES